MNEKEYRETVIKMRDHQDAWFRLHKQSDLYEARRLEKLIDNENKRWLDAVSVRRLTDTPEQRFLFKEDGNDEKS